MRRLEVKQGISGYLNVRTGSDLAAKARRRRPLLMAAVAAAVTLLPQHAANAITKVKANNTNNLNAAAAWTDNIAPVTGVDILSWDSTVTGAQSVAIGNNLDVLGLQVLNPGGPITITGTQTFSYRSGGIDMSAATQDLIINTSFFRASPNAITTHNWTVAAGRTLTINSGTIAVQGNVHTVVINGPGNAVINGNWVGTGGGMMGQVNDASAVVTLAGNNNFSGGGTNTGFTLTDGNVNINNDNALNGVRFNFDGGTIRSTTGSRIVNQTVIRLGGNGTIDGSNPLTFPGTFTNFGGDHTLTNNVSSISGVTINGNVVLTEGVNRNLTFSGTGLTTINGAITEQDTNTTTGPSTASGIVKAGSGTVILGSATGSTYGGTTTVDAGTLAVNNTSGSGTGTGTVIINNSGLLRGTGSVAGPVTVNSGGTLGGALTTGAVAAGAGAILAPGNSVGTLTVAGLDLQSGAQAFNLEFSGSGTNDKLVVTDLNAFLVAGAAGSKTINILSDGSGAIPSNTYTFLDYNNTTPLANLSQFAIGSLPLRTTANLINDTANTEIDVQLTVDAPKWVGNNGTSWDINSTTNWQEIVSTSATTYLQPGPVGDSVLFDNTAVNGSVNITTTVTPAAVAINNGSLTYNFAGSGKISGATGLTKSGTGTATLANTGGNDFTGATSVQGGTLALGASDVLSNASNLTVSGGATLAVGANNDTIGALTLIDGAITGSGGVLTAPTMEVRKGTISANLGGGAPLVKTTADTVTLSAPSSYTGGTLLNEGKIQAAAANVLPSTGVMNLGTVANLAGTLDLGGFSQTIGGLISTGTGSNVVTSTSAAVLTVSPTGNAGSYTGTLDGNIALNKQGVGTLILGNATNTYSGGTSIGGGVLGFASTASLGSGALGFTGTGGTLQRTLTGGMLSLPNNITIDAGGVGAFDAFNVNQTLDLTGVVSGSGTLASAGAGTVRLSNTNTYTGGTNVTGGNLRVANSSALGVGTVTYTGGTFQLESGVVVNNVFTNTTSTNDFMIDAIDGNSTYSGNITIGGGGQFRPGASLLGTLTLTGTSSFNNIFIVPRGNLVLAGTAAFNTGTGGSIFGRSNFATDPVAVTIQDNATLTTSSIGMGGGTVGTATTSLGALTLTVRDSAVVTSSGNIDLANALAAPSGSTINLDGGSLAGLGFIHTTPTIPATLNLNGGTLRTSGNNANFMPVNASLTAQVQNGGAVIHSDFDVTIAQPIVAAPASTGGLTKLGTGSVVLTSNANTWAGATTVNAGTLRIEANLTASASVNVTGGTLELPSNGTFQRIIRTGAVAASGTGKINIDDNKVITSSPVGVWVASANSYTGTTALIDSGKGASNLWDGATGIITTQTAAVGSNFTSIGISSGTEVLISRGLTASDTMVWGGQTISSADTLVMYTYGGDANLDGKLNIDDYIAIDQGIASNLTGWSNGDYNYDGKVNIDDYSTVIDSNIANAQAFAFPTAGGLGGGGSGVSAVPEPASISIIGLAALGAMRRRRRRN